MNSAPSVAGEGFDALRQVLRRPDLDDATLDLCLEATLGDLFGSGAAAPLKRALLHGRMPNAQRARVLASLCLPPPAAPLAMPVHALRRPRRRVLARLAAGLGRLRGGERLPVRVE